MRATKTIALFLALSLALQASGQTPAVYEIVKSDRDLAAAHEGPYDMTVHPQTKPPKGYNPFYISHYGRHGARYAWSASTYTVVRDALNKAKDDGTLTELGQRLYRDYIPFCKGPIRNYGCMVPLGQQQQAFIARTMAEQFPQVFRKGGKVNARASRIQRAITSMAAFCTQFAALKPDVVIAVSAYTSDLRTTRSQADPWEPDIIGELGRTSASLCSKAEYASRIVDSDAITAKFFTQSPFAGRNEATDFCIALYDVWSGYRSYCDNLFLEDIFTPDELCSLWDAANYRDCKASIEDNRCNPEHFVEDVITHADEAIGGNGICADLRFGHDIVMTTELMYLDINGMGRRPKTEEDVRDCFQTWNVPMASNLQFVFYRSRRTPDILFKLLLNGSEASLPALDAVEGPYYRWNDFKAKFGK